MASPIDDPSAATKSSGAKESVDHYGFLWRLQILAAIGCSLIFLYAARFWSSGDVLRIAGVGILVAAAALMAGFLLGFVFGVPRVGGAKPEPKATGNRESGGDEPAEVPSNGVESNSNLVEISDWLTKILVGVGLVELNSIPDKLGKLSYYVGLGLRPAQCDGHSPCGDFILSGQTAGLAILIFYFALGFLWCYVWTRLYFHSDLANVIKSLKNKINAKDRQILAKDQSTWAAQLVKKGELDEAKKYIDKAVENNPNDGRAVLTKAWVLKRLATKPETSDIDRRNLLKEALVCADRAITLLPGRAEPIYNKACYLWLLHADRNETLANLKSAFSLDPALRRQAANDPDLASLQQDADFVALTHETGSPDA